MAKKFKPPLPVSILFFIGLSAVVTFLLAISFIILGLLLYRGSSNASANYILISGLIMLPVSTLFTIGLLQLKNLKVLGRNLVSIASILVVLILCFSAFSAIVASPGWKLALLTFAVSAVIIAPFSWLTIYLWKTIKT